MRWALAIVAAVLVSCWGCTREEASEAGVAVGGLSEPRIVSLSPAISRTLVDFDLQRNIVGRTPHCASIDQSIPVVGDLLNADYEQLVRLRPTHILVQPPASGIDQHLVELAQDRGWRIGKWQLNGRDDIEAMVQELPGVLFSGNQEREADAARRAAQIVSEIADALSPGSEPLFRGRVLIVHAVEPAILVSGTRTYLDDIIRTFGASNATTANGWATLTLEDVARLNPEAIILVRPGARVGSIEEAAGPLNDLPIDAVRGKRMAVSVNPDGEMPSGGLAGVAREFRSILQQFADGIGAAP
ncbi:MAG: ABC transporter substrate-binding protein [Phycisphaerales bacterium]|nr:ABC transporter substrate-binding protein [Phycisphaerales bacterium]MCI0677179.1 ABC transporter substrate-binding protein [Phycisphaerales bacterium]